MAHIEADGVIDYSGTIEDVAVEVLDGDLQDGFPAVAITTPDGTVIDPRLDRDEAHRLVEYVGEAIRASEKSEQAAYAFNALVTVASADGRRWRRIEETRRRLMTDRCTRCGVDPEHHGATCDPGNVLRRRLLDRTPDADRETETDGAEKTLREARLREDLRRAERGEYPFPYPKEWDQEYDHPPTRYEWRVTHRRAGWKRSNSKVFQKIFYARRRYRRLIRSSRRAGLAPIEELRLEKREVGPWKPERDDVTAWYRRPAR